MINYYNENDPKAAAWLRELIEGGHIAKGVVDERSIEDVQPNDIKDFTQCHFFAGIGGWSYALRLAGWPDDRAVWTGSCPCQPFSDAGQKGGTEDKRHLWPDFFRLIAECRPATVFGEQVASKDGLAWLDIVSADLESADYAVGAADLCAAGVEAPHIRQRLWFVAHASGAGCGIKRVEELFDGKRSSLGDDSDGCCSARELAITESEQHDRRRDARTGRGEPTDGSSLVNAESEQVGLPGRPWFPRGAKNSELGHAVGESLEGRSVPASGRGNERSPWTPSDLVWCRDGKWRPVEPGTFPLAHGVPARVGRLRGYGNAIVPQVAAEFVRATMDSQEAA